ncbi:MAG: hypothetical protein ABI537_02270 [Casimicrobiaceae bacterium]
MKKSVVAAALLVVFVSGCTSVRVGPERPLDFGTRTVVITGIEGFSASAVTIPDAHQPNVFIIGGRIVVDQEPVRPTRELPGGGAYLVTWALEYMGGYSFPSDTAITFGTGAPTVKCRRGAGDKVIGCVFPKPSSLPVQWKYAITVKNNSTGDMQTLDPSMSMD